MFEPSPFAAAGAEVRVAVRLTPKASRVAILGLAPEAGGGMALKVAVTAPPEDGKANAALIKLLAKSWRLPKSAFAIIRGATDRHKLIAIACADPVEAHALAERLRAQSCPAKE